MIKYRIFRKDLNKWIDLLLVKYKNTEKYSFINLDKGHICECVFDSVLDAEKDLIQHFLTGKVVSIFREFPPENEVKVEG